MIIAQLTRKNNKNFISSWVFMTKSKAQHIRNVHGVRHKFSPSDLPQDFYQNSLKYYLDGETLVKSYELL